MANEFIIRKGFISLTNSQVTGSLDISGSVTASLGYTGSFTGSLFGTASYATTVLSASYATTASYKIGRAHV